VEVNTEAGEQAEHVPDEDVGIAFRPFVELASRRAVAYEVAVRPHGRGLAPRELMELVLPLSPKLGGVPAVVPLGSGVGPDLSAGLAEVVHASGVEPASICWLIAAPGQSLLEGSRMVVARSLVEQGFKLALEGVSLATAGRPEVRALEPSYLVVDRHVVNRLDTDPGARATIAGLLAFFGQLGGCLVADGVEDDEVESSLTALGVEVGTGRHLGPTAVLDARLAEPGDVVLDGSWSARRAEVQATRAPAEPGPAEPEPAEPEPQPQPSEIEPPGAAEPAKDGAATTPGLASLARRLQAAHDTDEVFATAVELIPQAVPVDRFAIFEADWESYRMVPRAVVGAGLEPLAEVEESLDSGITGWAFLRGEAYNCPDTAAFSETVRATPAGEGRIEESLVVVPLVVGDHRLGVLDVWRDGTHAFSDDDVHRLEVVGFVLAAAWHDAEVSGALERRSITDPLTGLLNMAWWDQLSGREAAQAVRQGKTVAVLFVVLEQFELINETMGRAVADVVVRNAARAIMGVVRTGDAVVRRGDGQFVILLHSADERAARRVADSVGEALSELPSPSREVRQLSAAVGVALFPEHGESLDEVADAAALAATAARAAGANEVRMFGETNRHP
jgi:diguanylate cyclase (GGDEF)-like protein